MRLMARVRQAQSPTSPSRADAPGRTVPRGDDLVSLEHTGIPDQTHPRGPYAVGPSAADAAFGSGTGPQDVLLSTWWSVDRRR